MGEIAYVVDAVAQTWGASKPNTTTSFWAVWTKHWASLSSSLMSHAAAICPHDDPSQCTRSQRLMSSRVYLRAANYAFIAQHPIPFTPDALEANTQSYTASMRFLDLSEDLSYRTLSIPYTTDDGENTTLDGYFICKNCSKDAPLVLCTEGGFDWTLAGVLNTGDIASYIEYGFSVLIYEGPGQGMSVRRDHQPLPFTPRWDRVVAAVAQFARGPALSSLWNTRLGLLARGNSFGGYLMAQACSSIDPHHVAACVANPGTPNFAYTINYNLFGSIIAPFGSVDRSLLLEQCGPACIDAAAYFARLNATHAPGIWRPCALAQTLSNGLCVRGSALLRGVLATYALAPPVMDPDVLYLPFKMLPRGPDTYETLEDLAKMLHSPKDYAGLVVQAVAQMQKFRSTKQEIGRTQVPIAIYGGTEDFALESSSGAQYFDALPPSIRWESVHWMANVSSGAALHNSPGTYDVVVPHVITWMQRMAYRNASLQHTE